MTFGCIFFFITLFVVSLFYFKVQNTKNFICSISLNITGSSVGDVARIENIPEDMAENVL